MEVLTENIEEQEAEYQDPVPKLKVKEFAAKIKAKFPDYKDIDDRELVDKIVAKHPEYKEQVDFTEEVKKKEPTQLPSKSSATALPSPAPSSPKPSEKFLEAGFIKPATIKQAQDKDMNLIGNLWNSFTSGIGRLAASGADLAINLLPTPPGMTRDEWVKQGRADVSTPARTATTELAGANVTEQQKANFDKNIVASTAGGLVEMIPAMGGKGLGLLLQAYDHGMESVNSTEEGRKLPENVKTVFSGTVGLAVGALDRFSLTKIFGKQSKKVATGVAIKVLTNLIKKSKNPVTAEMAEKAIIAEIKSLKARTLQGVKKVVTASATESSTEAVQEGVTMLGETILNKATGKEVFEEVSWKENLDRVARSAMQGAIGGGMLGTIAAPFQGAKNHISERISNAQSPQDIEAVKAELMESANRQELSETDLKNLSETIDNYVRVNEKVPPGTPYRREVVDKIVEREDVQAEVIAKQAELEKVDEAFQKEIKEDIAILEDKVGEINNEIENYGESVVGKVKAAVDEVQMPIIKSAIINGDEDTVQDVLKMASDQWHDEGTRVQAERDFGPTIISEAKKMFPQESKKSLSTETVTAQPEPSVPSTESSEGVLPFNFENMDAIETGVAEKYKGQKNTVFHGSPDISYLNTVADFDTVSNTKNAESKYVNVSAKPSTAVAYAKSYNGYGENSGVAAFELKGTKYVMKKSDIQGLKNNTDYENFYDRKKSEGFDYIEVPQDANNIVVLNNDALIFKGKDLSKSFIEKSENKTIQPNDQTKGDETYKIDDKDTFYHASGKPREGRLRTGVAPQFGEGVYFSTSKDLVTEEFGGHVTEAKLALKNPVETNTDEWVKVQQLAIEKADKDYAKRKGLTELPEDQDFFKYDKEDISDLYEIDARFISDAAKELGHDAIIDKGKMDYENEIVVLDESRIIYPEDVKTKEPNDKKGEVSKPQEKGREDVPELKDVESTVKALAKVSPKTINDLLERFKNDYSIKELASQIVSKSKEKFVRATDEQIQTVKNAKTPADVLDLIINTSKDENHIALANILRSNIGKAEFLEFAIDLPRDRSGYPAPSGTLASYGGGKINVSDRAFWQKNNNYYSSGLEGGYKTVLHEFVHAFTIDSYRKPKTKVEREFRDYIDKTYRELKRNSAFAESYGFKSPEEFIAEIATNQEFRLSAPIYKSGILGKIIEYIARMFGLEKNINAATDARYAKVKEALGFILTKIPEIRAGEGLKQFYDNPESLKRLSEAYHKAKKDGSNPELVNAVEEAINETKREISVTQEKGNTTDEAVDSGVRASEKTEIGGGAEPPAAETISVPVGDGKEKIGITHAEFDKIANEIGLPNYEKNPTTVAAWHEEADKRMAKGEMPAVIAKMEANDIPTAPEQLMIGKYVAGLKFEYNKTGSDAVLKEIYRIKQLSDVAAGRLWGEAGRARQEMMVVNPLEGGLASAMVAKMEANGTDVLTDAQKAEVKKQVAEYEAAAEKERKLREEAEAKNTEYLAQLEIEKAKNEGKKSTKSSTPREKKTSEDYKKERSEIKDSIREKLRKARGETNTIVIPYAKELITIAPDVIKLAKSYIEEGVVNLADIVKKAHGEIKDDLPQITEQDIRDIIAGKYNKRKETKNELKAKWYELQQEQKLLNELARVMAKEPRTEKLQREKNQQLTELRTKINEVKKEGKLDQYSDAQKLKNMKAANDRAAKTIEKRLADKDFDPPKPKNFFENFELKNQHPDLYNKVINAIHEKEEARHRFDIALAQDAAAKADKVSKVAEFAQKAINTTQQLSAGVDDSLMFVQLAHTLLVNPSTAINFKKYTDANGKTHWWGGAIKEHALDAASKKRFNRQMTALHNSPWWPVIQASKLDVLEPQSLLSQMKEEMFQRSFANKIGIGKANLGKFLEIWERAYTSLGNNVRVDLFKKGVEDLYDRGMTIENNLEEFKGLAKAINNLTGRGTTTPGMAKIVPYTTLAIWSPKMMASSINVLGISDLMSAGKHGYYSKLPPKARAYALKQMGKGIGISVAAMGAAALGGAIVHYDPRDPRFGEIVYGDDEEKSINVFLRYAGYIKLLTQAVPGFLGGGKMNEQGEVISVYDEGGKNAAQVGGKFLRGKFNPAAGLAYDYFLNDKKNMFTSEKITPGMAAEQTLIPMSLRGVRQTLERDGTIGMLNFWLPSFVGLPMKDARDYDDENFSPEINTYMRLNDIHINKPNKPKGMSEEDYAKYMKRRNERVEHDLGQLQRKGLLSGNKDQESVQAAIKQIVSWANEIAKFESVKGTTEEQKKVEIIKDYKPLEVKKDW